MKLMQILSRGALVLGLAGGRGMLAAGTSEPPPPAFPVEIRVDAAGPQGDLRPIWRFFGADEPNYATMKNGQKLIGELAQLRSGNVYFRAHNLLCTGDGTPALKWGSTNAYTEDGAGNPVYSWTILDRIFDTYRAAGVRPYAEIGFMPEALSIHPKPYQPRWTPDARFDELFTGWAYPPKDYGKWSELVFQFVRHCVERYGRSEVERWYWEVWNEANIGYWRGTEDEFLRLHDCAAAAVRRALPTARVGGPDCAGSGGAWMRTFLEHCLRGANLATGNTGSPLDFVSFHAKGAPAFVDGHVRMGIASELRTVDEGFRMIASYPELRHTPVVIGECDPEGCAACQGPQLAYRNGTMYSSYTAASFPRLLDLADRSGVDLDGALTWAFEFEGQPVFASLRSLATSGVDKPVLNVFRMFSLMAGRRLAVRSSGAVPLDTILKEGVRGEPDVSALASLDRRTIYILAWHYHDDDVPGPDAAVTVSVVGIPSGARSVRLAAHYRIDSEHSNAFAEWKRMASPSAPTAGQRARLEQSGRLELLPATSVAADQGRVKLTFALPRQAVSLLVLEWN